MINNTKIVQFRSDFSRDFFVSQILLIEDNSNTSALRPVVGISDNLPHLVQVRLHYIDENEPTIIAEQFCPAKLSSGSQQNHKVDVALDLLDSLKPRPSEAMVVASALYGCKKRFVQGIQSRNFRFTLQIRPSTKVCLGGDNPHCNTSKGIVAASLLNSGIEWLELPIIEYSTGQVVNYSVAELPNVLLPDNSSARLIVAYRGGVSGIGSNTIFALSSASELRLKDLVQTVGWVRWIRTILRKKERSKIAAFDTKSSSYSQKTKEKYAGLVIRSNINLARQQDLNLTSTEEQSACKQASLQRTLGDLSRGLNVVELFAGAGAMGLGFLMAAKPNKHYKIGFCGEVHPVYVETLKHNHATFRQLSQVSGVDCVPEQTEPLDLRIKEAQKVTESRCRELGDVHVLIGGPPCQGFSSANRNSGNSENPNNQLVDTFFKYVEKLKPRCFLMENVQGILWTTKSGQISTQINVVDWVMKRMHKAGYVVFPKLIDAAWYGVPQHRNRFFFFGIHKDLGYGKDDFGEWGPFPLPTHGLGKDKPYVTVRDAIQDLPTIGNGCLEHNMAYEEFRNKKLLTNPFLEAMREGASVGLITDHVTSRHSEYVIERYKQIPPGGNWQDIEDKLTNYTDVKRTHSNIYRRLGWDEPSITIGHYRKSMLIHPQQHRGLSLREASRLQSIPDWFRFAGSIDSISGGLVHKQQQLANAVCPLVTKAIAEFLFDL
ncbi:MAG: DNA (cytosine-5-)-methyltransferase [Stigonema ocellatum SAG 48.90 = DSM 106950]|nr:DNA (cytosine-5-)-methyltransferase [Stigonema ocellatum SAG 48.90 = DSM 106950]